MTEQTILIHERRGKCPECKGTGVSGGFDCEPCDGEGYIDEPTNTALSSQQRDQS